MLLEDDMAAYIVGHPHFITVAAHLGRPIGWCLLGNSSASEIGFLHVSACACHERRLACFFSRKHPVHTGLALAVPLRPHTHCLKIMAGIRADVLHVRQVGRDDPICRRGRTRRCPVQRSIIIEGRSTSGHALHVHHASIQ